MSPPTKPATLPMSAQLPAFGKICSWAANSAGLGPLACASAKQRLWLEDADEALSFLAQRGGVLSGFKFLALDERGWGQAGERLFGSRRGPNATPPPGSLACSATFKDPRSGALKHVASAREDQAGADCLNELAQAVGGPRNARQFVALHEWGHAWQARSKRAFVRQAAIHAATPMAFASLEALRLQSSQGRLGPMDPSSPHGLACARAEEAFCDALGCWGLGAMGRGRVAALVAEFREISRPISGPSIHMSHGALLDFFDWKAPMPADFKGFLSLAMSRGAVASSGLFGAKTERVA